MLFLVLSSIFLRASETVRTAVCRKQKQEGFPAFRGESLLFYQRERRVRRMRILQFLRRKSGNLARSASYFSAFRFHSPETVHSFSYSFFSSLKASSSKVAFFSSDTGSVCGTSLFGSLSAGRESCLSAEEAAASNSA